MERVQRLAGGARFLDDLPKELIANDEELEAVRNRTPTAEDEGAQ